MQVRPLKIQRGRSRFGGAVYWGKRKDAEGEIWLSRDEYNACRLKRASVIGYHNRPATHLRSRSYPKAQRTYGTGYSPARVAWKDGPEVEIVQWARRLTKCLGIKFHVDHTVPLSMGGADDYTNLRPIPAVWNLRKGNDPQYPLPECWRS